MRHVERIARCVRFIRMIRIRPVFNPPRRSWHSYAFYAFCLVVPALPTVHRFVGTVGTLTYVAAAIVAIPLMVWRGVPKIRSCSSRAAWLPAFACLAGATLGFAVGYPQAQARSTAGLGSDADDALNLAAGRLLSGQSPYAARTYLDHPISPLPGAVILAVPFFLLGNAAYQNVFWLVVYFAIAYHLLRDVRYATLHLILLLACSPAILHQHVVGFDWVSNAIYVMAGMHVVLAVDPRKRPAVGVLAALFLGMALSSRANFLLLLPILFAVLHSRFGHAAAIRQVAIAIAATTAVTVPFYLYDPANFSPAHTANKLGDFDRVIPYAGLLIGLAATGLSFALSYHGSSRDVVGAYRNCALVQMVPVLMGFAFGFIGGTDGNPSFLSYGVFFSVFGSLAWFAQIVDRDAARAEIRPIATD
jgi:hypothetical protein